MGHVHQQTASEDQMIREAEMLERAETYREMARTALEPTLRMEFIERAERHETVAYAVRGKRPVVSHPVRSAHDL